MRARHLPTTSGNTTSSTHTTTSADTTASHDEGRGYEEEAMSVITGADLFVTEQGQRHYSHSHCHHRHQDQEDKDEELNLSKGDNSEFFVREAQAPSPPSPPRAAGRVALDMTSVAMAREIYKNQVDILVSKHARVSVLITHARHVRCGES
jgi:hypothetical protein